MNDMSNEPTTVIPNGINNGYYKEWVVDGQYHRIGGPARIWGNDDEQWQVHDTFHRIDGPAETYRNIDNKYKIGPFDKEIIEYWWIDGRNITTEVEYWIEENNFPIWQKWTDEIKALFKLTFA